MEERIRYKEEVLNEETTSKMDRGKEIRDEERRGKKNNNVKGRNRKENVKCW